MGAPKAPSQITQTNKVELSPEQQKIAGLAQPFAESYANTPNTIFAGSGIAPITPLEQQAQAGYTGTAAPVAAGLASQSAGAQSLMLDPNFMLNPNQYVNNAADAVTQKTTTNLMENVLPGIRSGSTTSGGQYSGGSTRQGIAEGKAIGATNDDLSRALAGMYMDNYQKGMTGLSSAVNNNTQVMGQQLLPNDILAAVGGQQRAESQAALDEQIRKFYAEQDLDLSKAQQLYGLIGQMPGATGVSTSTGAQPQSNPLMQTMGLLSAGTGIMGQMGPLGAALLK